MAGADPGQQTLLILAYLDKRDTYGAAAAGFGVSTSTGWRYMKLRKVARGAMKAWYSYVVVDGRSSRSAGSPPTVRSTPASTGS